MKLCVRDPRGFGGPLVQRTDLYLRARRLMSDYEVNLVNDNMQEFYVRFYGPAESAYARYVARSEADARAVFSTVRRRSVEDTRRAAGSIPLQVPQHRLHEQDLPPEHR